MIKRCAICKADFKAVRNRTACSEKCRKINKTQMRFKWSADFRAKNKDSNKVRHAKWWAENANTVNAKKRLKRRANLTSVRAKERKKRAENPEKFRELERIYRENNRERYTHKQRLWREKNIDRIRDQDRNRDQSLRRKNANLRYARLTAALKLVKQLETNSIGALLP